MAFNKHTGFSFCLIGLLFPFLSSVCLASPAGNNSRSPKMMDNPVNTVRLQNNKLPPSDYIIKTDIDFINRLKNYRTYLRSDCFSDGIKFNHLPQVESLSVTLFSVPRPAYYNYLFMFKPFE